MSEEAAKGRALLEPLQRLKAGVVHAVWGERCTRRVFSTIHERNTWSNPESRSRQCATVAATAVVLWRLDELRVPHGR